MFEEAIDPDLLYYELVTLFYSEVRSRKGDGYCVAARLLQPRY